MKLNLHVVLILSVFFTSTHFVRSQDNQIDSLREVLNHSKEDTSKVKTLNLLGWAIKYSNPDTAIILGNDALALSEKLNWDMGKAKSNHSLGWYYAIKSDYSKALQFDFAALTIWEKMEKIEPSDHNAQLKAATLGNIGLVYKEQNDLTKAQDYLKRSLEINTRTGRIDGVARDEGNLGLVYSNCGDSSKVEAVANKYYEMALDAYFNSLSKYETLNDSNSLTITLGNIAVVYERQKEYSKAREVYERAMKISKKIGDELGVAISLGGIAILCMNSGQNKEAETKLLAAVAICDSLGSIYYSQTYEEGLSELYERTGRFDLSLQHYKRSIALRDSITNDENIRKQTQTEMNYVFGKKQMADSIRDAESRQHEQLKHDAEIAQQKIYTYGGAIGFLLMVIAAAVSFRAYKQKQRSNEIISRQKELVEEKQKEVLDSIHYAKRIQQSLLPTEKYISKHLKD